MSTWVCQTLTDNKAIRRGVFLSAARLKTSIETFLKARNQDPKLLPWTATVESIQEKLTRCCRTLEQIPPGCTSPRSGKRKGEPSLVISDALQRRPVVEVPEIPRHLRPTT
jgi:hypothetical protein